MTEVPVESVPATIIRALDQICVQLKYTEYRYRFERGSNDGDGIISVLTRVHVEGQRNGKPDHISLICKYQSSDKTYRDKFNTPELFEREIFVYTQVLPEFEKIQAEHGISRADGFFAYPVCYQASKGRHANDEIWLILEDMTESGFRMDPSTKIYQHELATLVYTQLGRLHALSFALRFHKPDVFEKFKQMDDLLHISMSTDVLQPLSEKSIELIASILDEEQLRQAVITYKNSLWHEMATKVLNGHVAEPYSVINHADCWLNNIMCRYEGGIPAEMILIDYQHTRYCSPAIDLINFTFSRAAHEIRTNHFQYFISIYYESFQRLLRRFGCDPDELFPYEVLQKHLKRFGIIGFALATFTIPANCGLDINNLPASDSMQFQNFQIEMKNLVRDANSLGYFDDLIMRQE